MAIPREIDTNMAIPREIDTNMAIPREIDTNMAARVHWAKATNVVLGCHVQDDPKVPHLSCSYRWLSAADMLRLRMLDIDFTRNNWK